MTNKNLWVALIAVAIIAIGGYFFPSVGKGLFGTISSTDITATRYTQLLVDNGIQITANGLNIVAGGLNVTSGLVTLSGGTLKTNVSATSSSATSQTLVASDVNTYDTVIFTPTVGSDTLTLFASSTATTFLPTAGNSQTTCIINGTTTTGVNLTLAGGTGTTLLAASSSATALGSLVIGPQKEGCLMFTRANATATTFDILSIFTTFK